MDVYETNLLAHHDPHDHRQPPPAFGHLIHSDMKESSKYSMGELI